MKYIIIPRTTYRTPGRNAFAKTSWQVVNIDMTIATCQHEEHAIRICNMMNGIGVYPDNIEAVRDERDDARAALQKWQDKCTVLMAERDESQRLLHDVERQRNEYAAQLNGSVPNLTSVSAALIIQATDMSLPESVRRAFREIAKVLKS